jgi:hypothetical protein
MTARTKATVGRRVLLCGQHPWVGHTGEVIERQEMTGVIVVRLDDGIEAQAWPRQYKTLEGS